MTLETNDVLRELEVMLKTDEGYRAKPYKDTVGKTTIGYGRNLDDVGISIEEAEYILRNDIDRAVHDVLGAFPWVRLHPKRIRVALYNMCFNMGIGKLRQFKKMLAAIEERDYDRAASEALDSLWARQVKGRAERIAKMLRG